MNSSASLDNARVGKASASTTIIQVYTYVFSQQSSASASVFSLHSILIVTSIPFSCIAGDAIDACYTRVNVRGDVFGHCGFSNGDYIPCLEM